jgi:hypothetical protein
MGRCYHKRQNEKTIAAGRELTKAVGNGCGKENKGVVSKGAASFYPKKSNDRRVELKF